MGLLDGLQLVDIVSWASQNCTASDEGSVLSSWDSARETRPPAPRVVLCAVGWASLRPAQSALGVGSAASTASIAPRAVCLRYGARLMLVPAPPTVLATLWLSYA